MTIEELEQERLDSERKRWLEQLAEVRAKHRQGPEIAPTTKPQTLPTVGFAPRSCLSLRAMLPW